MMKAGLREKPNRKQSANLNSSDLKISLLKTENSPEIRKKDNNARYLGNNIVHNSITGEETLTNQQSDHQIKNVTVIPIN